MKVLSLFDGISCGMVALERAGITVDVYYASEVEPNAIAISNKNYPTVIRLGDVTKWRGWDIPWEEIDLVIGGSPCQGFSFAGKQLNFDDPRSKLFFEFADILEYIKAKNPAVKFLLENVRMKKQSEDVITDKLGVRPALINSSLFSAQSRNRLYWTNIVFSDRIVDKEIFWGDIMLEGAQNVYYLTPKMMDWINKNEKRKNKFKVYTKESRCKMQMVEASHHKGISNQRCFAILDTGKLRYIHPVECERLQTLPDNYTEGVSNTQRYKIIGNAWTVDVIAYILRHMPIESKPDYMGLVARLRSTVSVSKRKMLDEAADAIEHLLKEAAV